MDEMAGEVQDRRLEWFVPKFGPMRFRALVGLLFLPYTGMVLSFSIIGSVLASRIHYDRVIAIVLIYLLGVGIGAHALDALGSKGPKPWGQLFTRSQLVLLALFSLTPAYGIAAFYIVRYAPLLACVALLEGFFVFAYNLEWFRGRFHTDLWFAFSWGFLPVLGGYLIQSNRISVEPLAVAGSMGFFSFVEIKASRPYRNLRKNWSPSFEQQSAMAGYEAILKSISFGVMFLAAGLLIWRTGLGF
jgi:hypothetical protein